MTVVALQRVWSKVRGSALIQDVATITFWNAFGKGVGFMVPFFIAACDYTLIGEELYAASAYLSREPLLLGSLKGQDLGKALIMVLIVIQSLLFAINADWNWLKMLVEPL